ncbi:MAG: hypothetical protein Q8M07_32050 [Prosthecobacter sp.]|nr:hypothetical protein [Prosthecobacter sp.]
MIRRRGRHHAHRDAPSHLPDDGVELYDLKTDPTEEKNLAAASVEKVKELSARLDALTGG